jgi:hypothetical protein
VGNLFGKLGAKDASLAYCEVCESGKSPHVISEKATALVLVSHQGITDGQVGGGSVSA